MSQKFARTLLPALVAAGLLAAGCGGAAEKAALPERTAGAASVGVRVVQPSTELAGNLVKATGRIAARHEAALSPRAGGTIATFHVDVGDTVKKGQALVQLDATAARITLEQARAGLAVAEAGLEVATQDLERARSLRASGGVSPAGLEKAEAGYKQASANVKQATAGVRAAERHLADHVIRAPFDGTITARLKNLGEYVATMPPNPVLVMVDPASVEVVLPVPETVIAAVQPGGLVRGSVNPSGKGFEARVRTIGTVVDAGARTVEVRADPVGDLFAEMRPNAIVEVDFSRGESISGLFLPAQSVQRAGDERFVWLVQDGKVARHPVQAEAISPGVVRVLGGLDPQAQVVAEMGTGLKDGMQVQVVQ